MPDQPQRQTDHAHHDHGHANDRGLSAVLRYLRWAPRMWRSPINVAVVDLVAPAARERVVDIGAGMGAGTMVLARRGASVVAVEPTPFLRLILTVRRLFQRSRKRIQIVEGAAEHLGIDDRTADAVMAVNTMHHWVDAQAGAAEIARVLRPGGRVVLVDEDFEDPTHPDHQRFGDHDDHADHHGFTMVDAGQLGTIFEAAGLTDLDASKRQLAGRPVIAVTGRAPG